MLRKTQTHQPTHRLYTVKGEGEDARWVEIGAAWTNRDGAGFSLRLQAMPLDGRILMRAPKAEKDEREQW